MIINRFALQRVEVQNSLFFMEAFEIMEMDMEFLRKLPTPKELKEQFPVSEKIAAIKENRDRQIREIFEGKDDRLLLIIGPCSADNVKGHHRDPRSAHQSGQRDRFYLCR